MAYLLMENTSAIQSHSPKRRVYEQISSKYSRLNMFVYLVICNKSQQNYEYDEQKVGTSSCLPSDDLFRLVRPRLPSPR